MILLACRFPFTYYYIKQLLGYRSIYLIDEVEDIRLYISKVSFFII